VENLAKILESLPADIKKQIAEQLLKDSETSTETKKKKRPPKSCAVPAKTTSKDSVPVNKDKHVNEFHNWIKGEVSNEVKAIDKDSKDFDKKIKRTVTPRAERSNLVNTECRSCNKTFKVSGTLMKHDGDGYYYECDKCMKKGRM